MRAWYLKYTDTCYGLAYYLYIVDFEKVVLCDVLVMPARAIYYFAC
jgi:hypothetical protein